MVKEEQVRELLRTIVRLVERGDAEVIDLVKRLLGLREKENKHGSQA